MAVDELIGEHVSLMQCKKAVTSLTTHVTKVTKQKEGNELLPGKEENVWLVLSVKKTTPEKKLKPHRIPLAHPIVDPRVSPICLITKDPQREYKDLLEEKNIKFIDRVVGVAKLKGKFKPFEARRMLMKENGLFLADERVVPLLPQLLGKIFFNAKKQPIPVSLTKKDLKGELERAVSSTYMHQNQGTCTSIKIGTITQSLAHILDNLRSALPAIAKRIDGGWDNIQSFHIKTNTSVSLPIWSCKLGEDGRWKAPIAGDADEEAENNKADEAEVENDTSGEAEKAATQVKSGKKRAAPEQAKLRSKKTKTKEKEEAPAASHSDQQKASKASSKPQVEEKEILPLKVNGKADGKAMPKERTPKASKSDSAAAAPSTRSVMKKTNEHQTGVLKIVHTPDELKQKRAGNTVEKKKEKMAKGKAGGRVKEQVLGKKAKSRI